MPDSVRHDKYRRQSRLLGKTTQTFREKIPRAYHDCRLLFQRGLYFLSVPVECFKLKPENQRGELVTFDPGAHTFQTIYKWSTQHLLACVRW